MISGGHPAKAMGGEGRLIFPIFPIVHVPLSLFLALFDVFSQFHL